MLAADLLRVETTDKKQWVAALTVIALMDTPLTGIPLTAPLRDMARTDISLRGMGCVPTQILVCVMYATKQLFSAFKLRLSSETSATIPR